MVRSSPPLVVPDGNWRQAARMMARDPELSTLGAVHVEAFSEAPRMRKATWGASGVSTLEAVAAALQTLGEVSAAAALLQAYDLAVSRTLQARGRIPGLPSSPPPQSQGAT